LILHQGSIITLRQFITKKMFKCASKILVSTLFSLQIEKIEKINFLREIYDNVAIYKINNKDIISISWIKQISAINAFWKKQKGFIDE